MAEFHSLLGGRDRRSIGRAARAVRLVLARPARLAAVIRALSSAHADEAAEKISARHPDWLQPHKVALLAAARRRREPELRWHLAEMLPRLALTPRERRTVIALLLGYLHDESRIVVAFAMQALADLAANDPALRRRLVPRFRALIRHGGPAAASRGRKLLPLLSGAKKGRKGR